MARLLNAGNKYQETYTRKQIPGSMMRRTSFSQMIRNLSYDFYNRSITAAEYRARRREILNEIDAEYNRHSSEDEDLTTFRVEKPGSPSSPDIDTEKDYFR